MIIYVKIDDAAKEIGLSPSTIKKYYLMIEEKGYRFARNNQGQLIFAEHEVEMFKKIIQLKNEPGMSVQKAVDQVVTAITAITIFREKEEVPLTDIAVMASMIKEMKEMMDQQHNLYLKMENELTELKEEQIFSRKLIESSKKEEPDYIKMMLETNRMMKEVMEMMAASKDKKGFWSRLFKKS